MLTRPSPRVGETASIAGRPEIKSYALHVHEALPADVAGLRVHAAHLPLLTLGNIQRADRRGGQRGQRVVDQQRLFAEPGLAGDRVGQSQVQQRVVRGAARPVRIGAEHTHDKAVPHGYRREPLPLVVETASFVAKRRTLPVIGILLSARLATSLFGLGHLASPGGLTAGTPVPSAAEDRPAGRYKPKDLRIGYSHPLLRNRADPRPLLRGPRLGADVLTRPTNRIHRVPDGPSRPRDRRFRIDRQHRRHLRAYFGDVPRVTYAS